MAKANMEELNGLHKIIAQYYSDKVQDGLDGEDLSSGTLAAINAFLKNNNITVDVVEQSPTESLSNKLQMLMDEDIQQRRQA